MASTVQPCDSVSVSDSAPLSELGSVCCQPPAVPALLSMDISSLSVRAMELYDKCSSNYYDAYRAYCLHSQMQSGGTQSSVVSAVKSVASSQSSISSLSAARIRSARRAAAWRAKQVLPRALPSGFCYARLFKDVARESVAAEVYTWPTFRSLLSQPNELARPVCVTADLRLVRAASGFHLARYSDVDDATQSWLVQDALIGLARRTEWPSGTYGEALARSVRGVLDSDAEKLLSLDDRLGGYVLLFRSQSVTGNSYSHGEAVVVDFPAPIPDATGVPSIFLAGSDDGTGQYGWRADVINHMSSVACIMMSPVRAIGDSQWRDDLAYAPFRGKLDWETSGLRKADVVFFYFAPSTTSSVSLLELGSVSRASGKRVLVCCPDGYLRAHNVRHFCAAAGVVCVSDFDEAISKLKLLSSGVVDVSSPSSPVASDGSLPDLVDSAFSSLSLLEKNFPLLGGVKTVASAMPAPFHVRSLKKFSIPRFDAVTPVMALDCEMVSASTPKFGSRNVLGRLSLVNSRGEVVYDVFVRHADLHIRNTNAVWGSGITWDDIKEANGAVEFSRVREDFKALVLGSTVVGYDVGNDLKVLNLVGCTGFKVVDVQRHVGGLEGGGKPGLARMVSKYLGCTIQASRAGHSSAEDAYYTFLLYAALVDKSGDSLRDLEGFVLSNKAKAIGLH